MNSYVHCIMSFILVVAANTKRKETNLVQMNCILIIVKRNALIIFSFCFQWSSSKTKGQLEMQNTVIWEFTSVCMHCWEPFSWKKYFLFFSLPQHQQVKIALVKIFSCWESLHGRLRVSGFSLQCCPKAILQLEPWGVFLLTTAQVAGLCCSRHCTTIAVPKNSNAKS